MNDPLINILRHLLDLNDDVEITDDTMIVDDLGADSLSIVDIVVTLEDRFSVEISDDDMYSIMTVGDLRNLISDLR